VVEGQSEGVEEEPPRSEATVGRAVTGVADDRVTDGGQVHADLMGPPTLQRELEQGGRALPAAPLQHGVRRARRLSTGSDRHLRRRARGPSDRRLHLTSLFVDMALHQRQVTTLHRPGGQLVDERCVRGRRARHRKQS